MTPRTRVQKKAPQIVVEETGPMPVAARVLLTVAALGAVGHALRLWVTPIKSWDLWFHMKAGELIFTTHRVPTKDVFSWTADGQPWMVNAWLSDLFFWLAWHFGGPNAVLLSQVIISILVFAAIGFFCWRISGRPTLALLTAYLAMITSYFRFIARPELFTMVLMVAVLVILFQHRLKPSNRIWWLVPIGLLWSNLHMGFTAAAAILGCFLIADGAIAFYYTQQKKPVPDGVLSGEGLRRLALVSAATMAATIINPYGPGAWTFMGKLSGFFESIGEWAPLAAGPFVKPTEPLIWTLLLLVGITAGSLALSRRPQDLAGLLLLGLFSAAAWRYGRQVAQLCLVAPFVAALAARGLRVPDFFGLKRSLHKRAIAGAAGLVALEAVMIAILVFAGKPTDAAQNPFGLGLDRTKSSMGSIAFLRRNGLVGRKLFNTLESGGWLSWNLWPEQKVFIDGRIDMYGLDIYNQYLEIAGGQSPGAHLEALGIDYAYLQIGQGERSVEANMASALTKDPNWALIYFDDAGMIFVRREASNQALINQHEYQVLSPLTYLELQGSDLKAKRERVLLEARRMGRECPDSAWGHFVSGAALQLAGMPREAAERLRLARQFALRWSPATLGQLEDCSGRAAMELGRYDEAARHFRNALATVERREETKPLESVLRASLGQALVRAGKDSEAEAELNQSLELNSGMYLARIGLGELKMARRQYADAAKDFEEALNQGDSIDARLDLARCYAKTGSPEDALLQLELAARMDPARVAKSLPNPDFDSIREDSRFQALSRR